MSITEAVEELVEEFLFFDDWADKYQHLIDQGRNLPPIKAEWQTEEYQLKGCQSVVYFGTEHKEDKLYFSASSDAAIVQGLIALLLRVYSGRRPEEIMQVKPDFLVEIGLDKHLSPTRKTGLASMVSAIQAAAKDATN